MEDRAVQVGAGELAWVTPFRRDTGRGESMYPSPYNEEPVLFQIGDIAVTNSYVIIPQGRYPLHGTTWTVQDSSQVSEGIPAVAIVLTIIFVWFCLLGLLFLLMKERRYLGFVAVSVTGPGFHHTTQFPAGPQTGAWAAHMASQARAVAAMAPPLGQ